MKEFKIKKKVYLHDTDATDIVYYSRHLEWFEEARIDFISSIYKSLSQLIKEDKISFLPINVNIDYKAPAIFEDLLTIKLRVKEIQKLKLILDYEITKEFNSKETLVSKAEITMLCIDIDKNGRPSKIPENLIKIFNEYLN